MCGGCCSDGKDPGDEKGLLSSPVRNRGCTDIVFLLLLACFCCGMVFVAVFSVTKGDAFRLVYGTDSYGNTCDEDNTARAIPNVPFSGQNLKGKPYLFFMDVADPDHSLKICVNQCPGKQCDSKECVSLMSERTGSWLCRYDLTPHQYHDANFSTMGPCPKLPVHESKPLLNRCIPANIRTLKNWIFNNIIAKLNKADVFQKLLGDLYASWQEMIILCFVALAFSVLMVLLIRFLAAVIVWIICASVVIASMVGSAFLWWTYIGFKTSLDKQEDLAIPLLDVDIKSEKAFLSYAVIASVLTLILVLILVVMLRRISLVGTLFQEAAGCVAAMPMLMLQPVLTYFLLILYFVYWVIVLAYLCTAEKPTVDRFGFVQYTEHELVSYFGWYHIIGLIWLTEYLIACQQFVVSSAVAQWYFRRNKKRLGRPILDAIGRLTIYHQGSVALGSFIIVWVKLPRMIIMYINKQLKKRETCCEKCLKYINSNAYTVIAVSGRNFCTSSKKAFNILVSNALRVTALNSIGDFVLFLAKLAVMAATGAVSIIWLKSRSDLHFFAFPVLLVCVFSYFVAHCFLSVYEMVVDALLLCFCEDCDMNDGSPDRPYFASKRLMSFVNASSTALNRLSGRMVISAETQPALV